MTEIGNKYQVMPPLSDEEYQALKADIAERGILQPVVFDSSGNIIDGHHRQRALKELVAEGHEVPPGRNGTFVGDLETDQQKRDLAWSLNMQRRHLDRARRREAVEAKLRETPNYSDRWIAELTGVDHKTVRSYRIRLESTGEIPRYERTVGKDGREYVRDIRNDYVEEAEYRTKLEESKKRRRIRDILKGQHRSPDEESGAHTVYYGPKTDDAIARHMGVTPGFVANERKELEERGGTLGEVFGALPDPPPLSAEEARKQREEEARRSREHNKARREAGYKTLEDHKRVIKAIYELARATRTSHHTGSFKPKEYITPEEAVEAYTAAPSYESTSLYYQEATTLSGVEEGRQQLEQAGEFVEAMALVMGRKSPSLDVTKALTYEQEALRDEIETFQKLADWLQRFSGLLAERTQQDVEVARKALQEKDRITQEAEEESKAQQGSVTPLSGAKRKKSS